MQWIGGSSYSAFFVESCQVRVLQKRERLGIIGAGFYGLDALPVTNSTVSKN